MVQRMSPISGNEIATRITEHKNAIKRHDLRSLPATHIRQLSHFQLGKNAITRTRANDQNTHANLKRHGTAQTMILLTDTLTLLQSTYNLRLYVKTLLIMTPK